MNSVFQQFMLITDISNFFYQKIDTIRKSFLITLIHVHMLKVKQLHANYLLLFLLMNVRLEILL